MGGKNAEHLGKLPAVAGQQLDIYLAHVGGHVTGKVLGGRLVQHVDLVVVHTGHSRQAGRRLGDLFFAAQVHHTAHPVVQQLVQVGVGEPGQTVGAEKRVGAGGFAVGGDVAAQLPGVAGAGQSLEMVCSGDGV